MKKFSVAKPSFSPIIEHICLFLPSCLERNRILLYIWEKEKGLLSAKDSVMISPVEIVAFAHIFPPPPHPDLPTQRKEMQTAITAATTKQQNQTTHAYHNLFCRLS